MPWYAIESVSDAFDESKALLFPFDLKRWLVLAVITFFAGGAGSSPSGGQSVESMPTQGQTPDIGAFWELIVFAILLVIVLWVVFLVVGSIMEFVFVDVLQSRNVRIRGPFGERTGPGLRLVGFRLALFLAGLLVAALVAVPIYVTYLVGSPVFLVFLLLTVPLAILVGILIFIAEDFTTAFAVPLICETGNGIVETWRQTLLPAVRSEWKQFGVYVLVKLGLGIAIGFALAIGMMFVAVPLMLLFGAGALLGGLSLLFVGLAAVMAVVLFVVVFVFVQMPVSVFMRYFSLSVLDKSTIEWTLANSVADTADESTEATDSTDSV